MLSVLASNILDTKVINHQGEGKGPGDVLPKAWGVGYLVVVREGQPLLEEFVGEGSRLRQAVDCVSIFKIDIPPF